MVLKFDELLTYKASRKNVDDLYKRIDEQFVRIDE